MIVKAPEERFSLAPEGTFAAVCVDEIDLGKVKSVFNGQERERLMCRIVWQIDELDSTGHPYLIKQDYTASLDQKAKLRKHLQSWRGREFSGEELLGFDLEAIVGHGCMISIVHVKGSRGGTFSNVEAVMKLPKGMQPPKLIDYIRVKDRKPKQVSAMPNRPIEEEPPDLGGNWEPSDSDVPF